MITNSKFRFHKNQKSQQQYKRTLHLESLEERALLSALPWEANTKETVPAIVAQSEASEAIFTENVVIMSSDLDKLEVPTSSPEALAAVNYNSQDITCLRTFLEQTNLAGVKNGTKLNSNYDSNDLSTWTGVTWSTVGSVKRVTAIDFSSSTVVGDLDLSGCTNLMTVNCNSALLTSINVAGCTAMATLNCSQNDLLTSVDVSGCTSLTTLNCAYSPVTYLNVSGCTALTTLNCTYTRIIDLDLYGCTSLTTMLCSYTNGLRTLDVSGCTALTSLYCQGSGTLSKVILPSERSEDLTIYLACEYYDVSWTIKDENGNTLANLHPYFGEGWEEEGAYVVTPSDSSAFYATHSTSQSIFFYYPRSGALQSPSLDIVATNSGLISVAVGSVPHASGYTLQYSTSSEFTNPTTKSVSAGNTTISGLNADTTYYFRVRANGTGSYITSDYSATVSDSASYKTPYNAHDLACLYEFLEQTDENGVKNGMKLYANLSSGSATTYARFGHKYYSDRSKGWGVYFTSSSGSTTYRYGIIWSSINGEKRITEINLGSRSSSLEGSLDFSGCTALTNISASSSTYGSLITSIDVSGCTSLTSLSWSDSQLTSLNVSGCTALTTLYCSDNQLTSLDVSKNTSLTTLYCNNNQLNSLDVSKNTTLTTLYCNNNQLTALDVSKNTGLTTLKYWNSTLNKVALPSVRTNNILILCGDDSSLWTIKDINGNVLGNSNSQTYYSLTTSTALPIYAISPDGTQTITFNDSFPLAAPTLTATATGSSSIAVTVDSVTNASGYTLQYSTNSDFTNSTILNVSSGNTTVSGLNKNTKYYFRVMANGTGIYTSSDYSGTQSATTYPPYNTSEITSIRTFLEQTDSSGVKNGTKLNNSYNANDPSTWGGVTWTNINGVMRATAIQWSSKQLVGSIDLSGFSALTELLCTNNQLTSINVSQNTAMTRLICYNNNLTNMNVTGCTSLTVLKCYTNQLTELNVAGYTALTTLECFNNQLTTLIVSGCTELTSLICSNNPLATLKCTHTNLTSLGLSNCTSLTYLDCTGSQLTELNLSANTALTELRCGGTPLVSLDVRNNSALTALRCGNSTISQLLLSNKNTALTSLSCYGTNLTSLDVSQCSSLTSLECYSCQLTELYLSANTALTNLDCNANQLTELNVSGCTSLSSMNCSSNQLTTLDVSRNIALATLRCWSPTLTKVIMSSTRTKKINLGLSVSSKTNWTFKDVNNTVLGTSTFSDDTYTFYTLSESVTLPISATNAAGTQTIVFSDPLPDRLATPSLSASATSSSSIAVTVGSVANASGYTLQYSTNSNFSGATTRNVSAGTNSITGLNASTTYYFRVMATGSGNYSNSDYSGSVSATTDSLVNKLATPTLSASANGPNVVSVTVGSVSNASEYTLQYSTNSNFSNAQTKSVSVGTSTVSGLNAGTTYYFRVMAIGSGSYSNSDYSSTQSVTTPQEQVNAEINARVVFRDTLTSVDSSTTLPNGITSVGKGSTVYAEIWLKDVENTDPAIIGGYLNMLYASSILTALEVSYGSIFSTQTGYQTFNNGQINTIGGTVAMGVLDKGDDEWVRLATVTFVANNEGTTTVSLGAPADAHDNMTRTDGVILSNSQISYGSAELEVKSGCPMDIDDDGYIGVSDYTLLSKAWRTSPGSANWNPACDIDGDGYVGVSDYTFLSKNWRKYTTDPSLVYPGNNASPSPSAGFFDEMDGLAASAVSSTADVRLTAVSNKTGSDTAAIVPSSLTQINSGDSFFVEIWVRNINGYENGTLCGLTGGYLNMGYSSDLLTVGEVTYGSVYSLFNNLHDTATTGSIGLIGGTADTGVLDKGDDEWVRLATVSFTATGTGDATVESLPPADAHDNLTLTSGQTLTNDEIGFGSLSLTIDSVPVEPTPDLTINGKKVTVSWTDENPAADSLRYRVASATKWTTKKLKAGENTFTFNAAVGTNYEIEVLRNQSEEDILQTSAVVLDQPKLKADKAGIKDNTFQVNVTNYTAKNLADEAKWAIVTINGVQTKFDIENQQGESDLTNGGKVTFENGLFTFTEMTSNTSYKVQVSFADDVSTSTASSNLSVKTLKAPYLAPEITSATALSDTSIEVTWETSCGKNTDTPAQKYTVQYSLDGNKWSNATTGATGNAFTIQKLKGDNVYQVRILATKDNAFEASAPSAVMTAETLATLKAAVVKNSLTSSSFQIQVTNYANTNLVNATILNVKSDKYGETAIALENGTGSAVFENGMTVTFENGILKFENAPASMQQKIQLNFSTGVCTTAWSSALSVKTAKMA